MKLHHPVLQLAGLIWGETEITDVVRAVVVLIVISYLRLDGVGAQQSMRDERTGQATGQYVVAQLQTQIVPRTDIVDKFCQYSLILLTF